MYRLSLIFCNVKNICLELPCSVIVVRNLMFCSIFSWNPTHASFWISMGFISIWQVFEISSFNFNFIFCNLLIAKSICLSEFKTSLSFSLQILSICSVFFKMNLSSSLLKNVRSLIMSTSCLHVVNWSTTSSIVLIFRHSRWFIAKHKTQHIWEWSKQ